ncbi:MAG TPA: SBBP repeat-containing protein [Pyrinomonadaceae bacterium]|nr:SBBP repeat-containing protein [Pyrinomonadaceae bacterium]
MGGGRPSAADPALRARVAAAYGQLPLSFVANEGQFDREVKFSSRGGGYELYLTRAEAVLSLGGHAAREEERRGAHAPESDDASAAPRSRAVLRMKLSGARRGARASGEGQLPGRVNYLIGDDPAKWRTGVRTFAAVRYEKVYPGVDLIYYGNQRQLEYDFVVAPHADPRSIRIRFEGARSVSLDAEGQLLVRADGGEVVQRKPLVYQSIGGGRREVSARYTIDARREIGFALGDYDRGRPLVIDPVLSYATFLGGSGDEQANAVAVDANGNAYITGQTGSANFPVASPAQGARAAGTDAFVSKLNPAGTALVYSTYLGGGGADLGFGIAADADGNAYVTGATSSADFPSAGVTQACPPFPDDAFVTKLNPASAVVYSTCVGGDDQDQGLAIANAGGAAYVVGLTGSPNFPTTPSARQPALGGFSDAFAVRVGSAADLGVAIAASRETVMVGNDLVYTITVTNSGPSTTVATLTDALPAGVTLVSASATQGRLRGDDYPHLPARRDGGAV